MYFEKVTTAIDALYFPKSFDVAIFPECANTAEGDNLKVEGAISVVTWLRLYTFFTLWFVITTIPVLLSVLLPKVPRSIQAAQGANMLGFHQRASTPAYWISPLFESDTSATNGGPPELKVT